MWQEQVEAGLPGTAGEGRRQRTAQARGGAGGASTKVKCMKLNNIELNFTSRFEKKG